MKISGSTRWVPSIGRVRTASAALVALALAFATPSVLTQSPAAAEPAAKPTPLTDAQVNRSLDALARKMAVAVRNSDLRSAVHGAVGKRFDGDTDALWSSLASKSAFSQGIAGNSRDRASIASEAAKMPRLQVAVPEHFDTWDPATYAPLVAYFPEGVDDTTLKTITAYDSAGNPVELDAQVAPDEPVIVLSLNERVDEEGELVRQQTTSTTTSPTALPETSLVATAAPARYSVDMVVVELKDDKEPWAKGDAEISMKARSRGCSGTEYLDTNWANLNNSGDVWGPAGGRDLGSTTCDVVFYWWEDDGGSANFTLSYGGFSLGVSMDDGDDLIGGKQLPYASFKGSTMREDVWTALEQWTE